jgi:hypothetical protein
MDDWIFCDGPEIDNDIYLPADLYRRNAKGIASYLFSGAMARESAWILARSIPPLEPLVAKLAAAEMFRFSISRVEDIHTRPSDFDVAGPYDAQAAMAAFRRITDPARSAYLAEDYNYDAMVRTFESDAIGLIENNPDVQFDIYFAPYSILQFVAMRHASPATLRIVYDFTAYAFPRLVRYPNVTLHDFRAVKEITHYLNNYADVIHHSPAVDLKVLSWRRAGIRGRSCRATCVAGAAQGAGGGLPCGALKQPPRQLFRKRAAALPPNTGIRFTASTTPNVIASIAMPSTAIAARSPLSLRS